MSSLPWLQILLAAYVVWVLGACTTLLLGRRSPASTLAWIFAFVALPFVSGAYYVLFGPRRLQRRRLRYNLARGSLSGGVSEYLRASCCQQRPALAPESAGLAAVGRRLGQGDPTFASAVQLLDNGDACMEAIAQAIASARHHVHLEYYIWEPDQVGTQMRDRLVEGRKRGLEVRVLYDAVGSPNLNAAFWHPLVEAGGEVHVFNPLRLSMSSLVFHNFRSHRKIVVCDGTAGFLGGVNMHDPASATRSGPAAWRDAHARIDGEPVRRLQRLFLENWIYAGGRFELSADSARRYFPPATEGRGTAVQVIASGPDDETASLHAFFLAALSTARSRAWIETPYLIPDEPLESALRIAVLRGVDVQVVVPKQGDSRLVTAASHTYCESLAKAGVAVHEYGPPMLHAKTMVIDDTVAVLGTANLDNRSFRLNFEVAAAFYDADAIAHLAARFKEDRAQARPFSARGRGPRLTTFLESIARLTSPVL